MRKMIPKKASRAMVTPVFRFSWPTPPAVFTLSYSTTSPLPTPARKSPFAAQLLQLSSVYPTLHIKNVVGDAAFGYSCVLRIVHKTLKARRVIDLRAHQTDRDKPQWLLRGYDDTGRPICAFGYPFTSNGFDFGKHRHKWFCGHACRQDAQPVVAITGLSGHPSECPHLKSNYGEILNIGFCFPNDASCRLVRDVAVGSPTWKRLYHRARNASESRNATFEHSNLKRLPVYGQPRGKAFVFLADVWSNLTTLARLFRQATAATGG